VFWKRRMRSPGAAVRGTAAARANAGTLSTDATATDFLRKDRRLFILE
jgi:hypothetical protein